MHYSTWNPPQHCIWSLLGRFFLLLVLLAIFSSAISASVISSVNTGDNVEYGLFHRGHRSSTHIDDLNEDTVATDDHFHTSTLPSHWFVKKRKVERKTEVKEEVSHHKLPKSLINPESTTPFSNTSTSNHPTLNHSLPPVSSWSEYLSLRKTAKSTRKGHPAGEPVTNASIECPPTFFQRAAKLMENISQASALTRTGLHALRYAAQMALGGYTVKGAQLIDGVYGCGYLPLRRDQSYTYYTPAGGFLQGLKNALLPFWGQGFFGQSSLTDLAFGYCLVTDCDTVAISFTPAMIPIYPQTMIYLYGAGFSLNGNLEHNLTAMNVWDGEVSTHFIPKGHVWIQMLGYIYAYNPSKAILSTLSVIYMISFFGGNEPMARNVFITLESISIMIFDILPVIRLASGHGGYRYTESYSSAHICSPSGIFARVSPTLDFPLFSSILSAYLGKAWFWFKNDGDLAIHIDQHDGASTVKSLQLRAISDLVIMGLHVNQVLVEVQYFSPDEIVRKAKRRNIRYGCICRSGWGIDGICRDALSPVDHWMLDHDIKHHIVTVSAEYNATLIWDWLGIRNAHFIVAIPVDGILTTKSPYLSVGGKLDLLFVRDVGAELFIQLPAAHFEVTTEIVGLGNVLIKGEGDTSDIHFPTSAEDLLGEGVMHVSASANSSAKQISTDVDGSLLDIKWKVQIKITFGKLIRSVWAEVHSYLVQTSNQTRKMVNGIRYHLHRILGRMDRLFHRRRKVAVPHVESLTPPPPLVLLHPDELHQRFGYSVVNKTYVHSSRQNGTTSQMDAFDADEAEAVADDFDSNGSEQEMEHLIRSYAQHHHELCSAVEEDANAQEFLDILHTMHHEGSEVTASPNPSAIPLYSKPLELEAIREPVQFKQTLEVPLYARDFISSATVGSERTKTRDIDLTFKHEFDLSSPESMSASIQRAKERVHHVVLNHVREQQHHHQVFKRSFGPF